MTGSAPPTARRLDRRTGLPLYAQLVDDLQRRLARGDFVNSFPGEHDLCREYDVSRHTVREALRGLRDRGVLDSGRGRATKIRQERIEQPLGALYSLFREVESRGMEQRSVVLALEKQHDSAVAARLMLEPDAALVHLARLRLADGAPLAVDRAWLPFDVAAPLLEVDFTHSALYDELESRCAVHPDGGRELITAAVPAPTDRELLQLPQDVGALLIERQVTAAAVPVECRTTVLRGDAFAVSSEWSPRTGLRLDVARKHTGS